MRTAKIIFAAWLILTAAASAFAQNPPPIQSNVLTQQLTLEPQAPVAPVTTVQFQPSIGGSSTFYYWFVSHDINGNMGAPAGPFLSNFTSTPSSSYPTRITFTFPSGVVSVDILRLASARPPSGSCGCAVATGVAIGSLSDNVAATTAYTVSTSASQIPEIFTNLISPSFNPQANDAQFFVSVNGQDSNNGLSWGTAKATLTGAFSSCPSAGCTIRFGDGNFTVGTFDPGATPVTLLLGHGTYAVTQIILENSLHIIGKSRRSTILDQASASTAPFVLSGAAYPQNVAQNVELANFDLEAAASSTTDGISAVAQNVSGSGGGLWYSSIHDLNVGLTTQFGRNELRFDSTAGGSPGSTDQFDTLYDIFATRAKNGAPVLYITGGFTGQFSIWNCEFDGQGFFNPPNETGTNNYNIRVDDGGNTFMPYSIDMHQVTSQGAWGSGSAAIFAGGVSGLHCENCHFEDDNGVIKEAIGAGGHGNWATSVTHSYMATNTGIDSGNGFVASTDANSALDFTDNEFFGTPDATFVGTSTFVNSSRNFNQGDGELQPFEKSWLLGTCTMAAGTSCTSTIPANLSNCIATVQGTTVIAGACSISGTTLRVTAASSNSDVWAWKIIN